MDLLGRVLQWRGRAWGCLMRNDIPCPSRTGKLFTYHAGVAGWNQTQILISIPAGPSPLPLILQHLWACESYQYNWDVLQLPGLFFSVFLLFADFVGQVGEAQDLSHDRGIHGPIVHNSGQIKIGILGCRAGDRTSSLTLLRVQNLVPPMVS